MEWQELTLAVARRWFDQAPDSWHEEGIDSPDDLRKDVGQILRCLVEELHSMLPPTKQQQGANEVLAGAIARAHGKPWIAPIDRKQAQIALRVLAEAGFQVSSRTQTTTQQHTTP